MRCITSAVHLGVFCLLDRWLLFPFSDSSLIWRVRYRSRCCQQHFLSLYKDFLSYYRHRQNVVVLDATHRPRSIHCSLIDHRSRPSYCSIYRSVFPRHKTPLSSLAVDFRERILSSVSLFIVCDDVLFSCCSRHPAVTTVHTIITYLTSSLYNSLLFFPCSRHSHKWRVVMEDLAQTTLKRHITALVAILAKTSASQPPSYRPPTIPPKLLWSYVMRELLSTTTPYSASPQSPDLPLENWEPDLHT